MRAAAVGLVAAALLPVPAVHALSSEWPFPQPAQLKPTVPPEVTIQKNTAAEKAAAEIGARFVADSLAKAVSGMERRAIAAQLLVKDFLEMPKMFSKPSEHEERTQAPRVIRDPDSIRKSLQTIDEEEPKMFSKSSEHEEEVHKERTQAPRLIHDPDSIRKSLQANDEEEPASNSKLISMFKKGRTRLTTSTALGEIAQLKRQGATAISSMANAVVGASRAATAARQLKRAWMPSIMDKTRESVEKELVDHDLRKVERTLADAQNNGLTTEEADTIRAVVKHRVKEYDKRNVASHRFHAAVEEAVGRHDAIAIEDLLQHAPTDGVQLSKSELVSATKLKEKIVHQQLASALRSGDEAALEDAVGLFGSANVLLYREEVEAVNAKTTRLRGYLVRKLHEGKSVDEYITNRPSKDHSLFGPALDALMDPDA